MSHPNQPRQPGSWGTPNPAGQQPSSAWQQGDPAWQQGNPAWQQGSTQAWGTQSSRQPAAPRQSTGQPGGQFDGQTPVGDPRQPSVSIQQFKPRRNPVLPVLLVLAVLAVVGGLLHFGLRPEQIGGVSASPSMPASSAPSDPARTVAAPSPGEYATETLFESDRVSGLFRLNSSSWEDDTLIANVTIEVDSGSFSYQFFGMDMATGDLYEQDTPRGSDLSGGTISAGESVTGSVRITKPRGDTQLVLSDVAGRNLTILAVKG